MPRIMLESEATAIAVGAADEVLEFVDRNRSLTRPFFNFTDWGRVTATGLAGFAYYNDQMPRVTLPVLYSGTALSVKSVSRLMREGFAAGSQTNPLARAKRKALNAGATIDVPDTSRRRVTKVTRI